MMEVYECCAIDPISAKLGKHVFVSKIVDRIDNSNL